MTPEARLTQCMTGSIPSTLMTDAYKLAMGQAGFPGREETFVFSLRKGGPFYIGFDLKEVVGLLAKIPRNSPPTHLETRFLEEHGFGLTPAMLTELLQGEVTVAAPPKGSWVLAGEPLLTITGPSILVSWLEPLVIMLHFPIQICTDLKQGGGAKGYSTTCADEREIIRICGSLVGEDPGVLSVDDDLYTSGVAKHCDEIAQSIALGTPQAFEVGLRAATCMEQHLIALKVCRRYGITKTSNVYGAFALRLTPVGTTGHEHQQRWALVGGGDESGFRAVRDMRPGRPSYLFDAFDPINLGIPAAVTVMAEDLDRMCAVRFDSGDQDAQLRLFVDSESKTGVRPDYIFEDGYTAEKVRKNEAFCDQLGIHPTRRLYGFGGYLISKPAQSGFDRDRVSAAYKLSESAGQPTMKFSGSPGKESLPGRPVIYRRVEGGRSRDALEHASSIVAQEGEKVEGFAPIDPNDERQTFPVAAPKVHTSRRTTHLINYVTNLRSEMLLKRGII